MWPGYGENSRVLDWILRRIDDEPGTAQNTPIGYVPTRETFNTTGLKVDFDALFSVSIDFWKEEVSFPYPAVTRRLCYEPVYYVFRSPK